MTEAARRLTRPPRAGADPAPSLFEEVVTGLSSVPRRLPAKLLYDERGARLFEEITRTEAYYPTRTEVGILERCLPQIRKIVGRGAVVVEFGTGDGRKTAMLLEALDGPAACVPIDISRRQLLAFAAELRGRFPSLEVLPLTADYTRPFVLPRPRSEGAGEPLVFFPGSTIGNLEPTEAERFLRTALESVTERESAGDARLLIGVDLVKPTPVLLRAYDDPEGITAEFNRNTLRHLNRRFDGDFPVDRFEHRALWNEERSRIEMHLVSPEPHAVTLHPDGRDAKPFHLVLSAGEPIVTEHSYKYSLDGFTALCEDAGWRHLRSWTDPEGWFGVLLLES